MFKAIDALTADGGTETQKGLKMANEIFKNNPIENGQERNRVVILFTDGEPGLSGYDNDIATQAINEAKTAKETYSAKVYAIGMFQEADPTTTTGNANGFMQKVSSNNGTPATDGKGYYFAANDVESLNSVFDKINSEITSGGATNTKLDASTQVIDEIPAYFKAPADADVSLKVANCTGNNVFDDANAEVASNVTASVENGKLTVTGFDFTENWCGQRADGSYGGQKLIITFTIAPIDNFLRGNVYSNVNGIATIANGDFTQNATVKKVDIPVLAIQPKGTDITIEVGSNTTVWDQFDRYFPVVQNEAGDITGTPFTPNGTNNAGVNITYTLKMVSKNGQDVTNPVLYTWTVNAGATSETLAEGVSNLKFAPTSASDTETWTLTATVVSTEVEEGKDPTPTQKAEASATAIFTARDKTSTTGTLTVTKTFVGLNEDQIEGLNDFTITLKKASSAETDEADYVLKFAEQDGTSATAPKSGPITDEQGRVTYTWELINVPVDTYTVNEKGESVDGYTVSYAYTGVNTPETDAKTITVSGQGTQALGITNTYTSTATTGTLTITKVVTDGSEVNAINKAANGKEFVFAVSPLGSDGSIDASKKTYIGTVEYKYDATTSEVTATYKIENLPFGNYKISEISYPMNLGYDKGTGLFHWSHASTTFTVDEEIIQASNFNFNEDTTITCTNKYNYIFDGFSKHATELSGTTSDITLTIPKSALVTAMANSTENASTEVEGLTIAQLYDLMGSSKVDGKAYDFDFVQNEKEIWLDLGGTDNKVYAEPGVKNEILGKTMYDFVVNSGDNKETIARLTYNQAQSGDYFYLDIYQEAEQYIANSVDHVKLHYQVKLNKTKLTAKGTYGAYSPYGEDTTSASNLLTNTEATLTKLVARGNGVDGYTYDEIQLITYPLPTVSYTVSGGNGGGGGHSRPTLNTEDHYGYIIGYPDGTVQPGGSITRAEVATIFFRMLTDSSRTEFWSQTNSFSDVPSTAWFNNAVSTLTKAGIIAGYEDGTFQPNATITRAEFATIAVRFFEASYDGKDFFTDIDGHWAQQYINDAANAGLVNGYEDGTFGPNKAITRAEAMTLVNRALDRHPDADHFLKDMITWPDNSDTTAWYYEAVQEATNSHEYTMKTNTDKTKYENWTKMLKMRDWKAFEAAWSDANSASNPGEVMGK